MNENNTDTTNTPFQSDLNAQHPQTVEHQTPHQDQVYVPQPQAPWNEQQSAQQQSTPYPGQPVYDQNPQPMNNGFYGPQQSAFAPQKSKNHTTLIAIIAGAVALVILAVVAIVVIFNLSAGSKSGSQQSSSVIDTHGSPAPKEMSATGPGSSFKEPLPLGTKVENDDWAVTINAVNVNANSYVTRDRLSKAPESGKQYLRVEYTLEYKGNKNEGVYPTEVTLEAVSPDGLSARDALVFIHSEMSDSMGTLYHGAKKKFVKYFQVPIESADKTVISILPGHKYPNRKFFVAVK